MADIPGFTTRPELAGTFGMVASTHWLASAAGIEPGTPPTRRFNPWRLLQFVPA